MGVALASFAPLDPPLMVGGWSSSPLCPLFLATDILLSMYHHSWVGSGHRWSINLEGRGIGSLDWPSNRSTAICHPATKTRRNYISNQLCSRYIVMRWTSEINIHSEVDWPVLVERLVPLNLLSGRRPKRALPLIDSILSATAVNMFQ